MYLNITFENRANCAASPDGTSVTITGDTYYDIIGVDYKITP